METTLADTGNDHMQALVFGSFTPESTPGTGPWALVGMENGFYGCAPGACSTNTTITSTFVHMLSRTDGVANFTIKAGDATSNASLTTMYSGALPPGYAPLHMEGGLSIGEGGDATPFYPLIFAEGIIIAGQTTNAVDDLVQASVWNTFKSAAVNGCMQASNLSGAERRVEHWVDGDAS